MDDSAFALAQHYYELGRYDEVERILSEASLMPSRVTDLPGLNLLVHALLRTGKHRDARDIAEQLLSNNPNSESVKRSLVYVSLYFADLAEAGTQMCQDLLRVSHKDSELWRLLAELGFYHRTISDELLIEAIGDALRIDPENDQTLATAHLFFDYFGLHDKAQACVERLAQSFPDSERTYCTIAQHLAKTRANEQLAQVCMNGLVNYPQSQNLRYFADVAAERLYDHRFYRLRNFLLDHLRPSYASLWRGGRSFKHRLSYYGFRLRGWGVSLLERLVARPLEIVLLRVAPNWLFVDRQQWYRLRMTDDRFRQLIPDSDLVLETDDELLITNAESAACNVLKISDKDVCMSAQDDLDVEKILANEVGTLTSSLSGRTHRIRFELKLSNVVKWRFTEGRLDVVARFLSLNRGSSIWLSNPDSFDSLTRWLQDKGIVQVAAGPKPFFPKLPKILFVAFFAWVAIKVLLKQPFWPFDVLAVLVGIRFTDFVYHQVSHRPHRIVLKRDESAHE